MMIRILALLKMRLCSGYDPVNVDHDHDEVDDDHNDERDNHGDDDDIDSQPAMEEGDEACHTVDVDDDYDDDGDYDVDNHDDHDYYKVYDDDDGLMAKGADIALVTYTRSK